jgi:hypothetical protein
VISLLLLMVLSRTAKRAIEETQKVYRPEQPQAEKKITAGV